MTTTKRTTYPPYGRNGSQGRPPPLADRRPPPRRPAGSKKQRQEAAQRQAAEQHRPIGSCQPKQPAFTHHISGHRRARCETIRRITTTCDHGCSARVTARLNPDAGRQIQRIGQGLSVFNLESVAFLPHVAEVKKWRVNSEQTISAPADNILARSE